ncbi:MAG: D-alanine-D-alanine ligase [Cellvibrionaceae bacterium]|jgi:D-alanine-D-alanine ligase
MSELDFKRFGRVGVLYGGTSAERDVSLASGHAIIAACNRLGVDVVDLELTENVIQTITAADIDTALIALHGGIGEDGRLQALLELMGITYTGSDVASCAIAMNKLISKRIWRGINLPTPSFYQLDESSNFEKVLKDLNGSAIVKPASEGSSIGMAIVHSVDELKKAFSEAHKYDALVFAEELLKGPEYTVGLLAGEVLPAIKLETDNVFYDYEAKYLSDETRYICPCGLSDAKEREIRELSRWAFESLDCRGWGRVDLMVGSDGEFKVLEVNTVPGMTSHSLVPMAAKAAGYSFDDLVSRILMATAASR